MSKNENSATNDDLSKEGIPTDASSRYALISVSDRAGLETFAAGLVELGYTLLTTSGSGKFLKEHGLESTPIEEFTGQAEILGGRVKTLHPKIHGGILAKRDNVEHQQDLAANGLHYIDIVAVNLYPFEQQLASNPSASTAEMVEFIDIGGPTMIRAAAKNAKDVYAVIDPLDYPRVLAELKQGRGGDSELRTELATKVFSQLAHYNLEIARFLSRKGEVPGESGSSFYDGSVWQESQQLRYGENPQQQAALFQSLAVNRSLAWKQLAGKELSYNNLLDADAGFRLIRSLYSIRERFSSHEPVCIMKHLTPCGVAIANTQESALVLAKRSDPRSHFGGIIGFSSEVSEAAAQEVVKDFSEIVIAPSYSKGALAVFEKRPNIRLIEVDFSVPLGREVRSTLFGFLSQEHDSSNCSVSQCELVAGEPSDDESVRNLELAWTTVTHTKSNAIVLVNNQMLIGAGAGQTSRIDSVEVALYKAREHGHVVDGAVAASDAFFPFPDSVERLANSGVKSIITPHGSKKDGEIIEVAKELGVTLLFAPERHFRH
ncbi:MAG: bifunctional phosphoribosylaminoimidazolecarboxamide formyltransferase/IMP cyclohydrolase [Bdellovibrionales bacterium]|nr:bifunctional phosphoribosylaminoimidazolecarboxamide formyltransferase/IMP cyclohydrolase [Bdellovibrionales bacterium]